MKLSFAVCLLFVFTSAGFIGRAVAQDSVIILRHGEKPKKGDNLNCKGLNRAIALPRMLESRYGVPDYIYVPKMKEGNVTKHSRMFQTVTPLAARYNISINTKFEKTDSTGVAKELKALMTKNHKKGNILVVWEHHNAMPISRALGVPASQVPVWADDDYDSIWIITGAGTRNAKLTVAQEGLNGVSENCQ